MDESKKKDRYEDAKKFVRYSDGAKMYSMGMTKFQEVAKDAKACYKIGQLVLVNTEILDKYLESLNEITDDIYDLEEFVKTITDMGIWLYSLEVGPVPIIVSHAEDFGC